MAPGLSVKWPELLPDLFLKSAFPSDSVDERQNKAAEQPVFSGQADSMQSIQLNHLKDYSDSLYNLKKFNDLLHNPNSQTRVLYYGDSQLEGDRITELLRIRLREISGGSGPGLLSPGMLVPYTRSSSLRASSNWERYNYLSFRDKKIEHKQLGPLMNFSRFIPPDEDGDELQKAWIRISPSRFSDSLTSVYEKLRLFYGNLLDTLVLRVYSDDRLISKDLLLPVSEMEEYSLHLDSVNNVKIEFEGSNSPDVYGLSLESETGVSVDNISNRGSAGLEFTMCDRENLEKAYSLLKPDLIILHYGLNVVLSVNTDFSYYEEGIYRQLRRIQSVSPGSVILVVSLTDMAHREDNRITSYKNIPLIRSAQQNAAARAGVLFWDAWEAMGGEDAIIDWSEKIPALAARDYTHLTYKGGDRLAELLLDELIIKDDNDVPGALMADNVLAGTLTEDSVNEVDAEISRSRHIRNLLFDAASYEADNPLLFTRLSFWIFLFVLLLLYSLIFNKPLMRNSYLFLISLFFYYKSGGLFFTLLMVSTLTDYLAGLIIHAARRKAIKKLFVFFSLLVNLGMLSYFKYTGFITETINSLLHTNFPVQDWFALLSNRMLGSSFDISFIILPVGISFFTFQTISYTLDVYRGKTAPVRNILDFGFYVSFFPQLVAGPIVRASEFVPQLYAKFSLTTREWGHAVFLIISGLIKKIIISDLISVNFVDRVFATPEMYSGLENLLAVYGYGLQIYCDFSGYTDIAIGVALLLGFRLPVNFNSPYKALNITDFWRRWHISLSRWLKDYLYISLGGNRKGKLRTNVNLLITMLLGGLWHGASWSFVFWGALHGFGLVFHKLWMRIFPGRKRPGRLKRIIAILITFNFVSFAWIFFRAESMDIVYTMIRQIAYSFRPGSIAGVFNSYGQVFLIIGFGYILHYLPVKIKESYRGMFIRTPLIVKMLIIYLIALVLYNVQSADIQPFIYFRF